MKNDSNRVVFMDNMRYLLVISVVIMHVSMTYSNLIPWWCVKDKGSFLSFYDSIILLFDVFLMTSLFFISGYFAIPTYQKKNPKLFLKGKIKRLGLPLLIVIPLFGPAYSYLEYVSKWHTYDFSFITIWKRYMAGFFNFNIGYLDWQNKFNHSHLWFLSLLLFFFILFTTYAQIRYKKEPEKQASPALNPLWVLLAVSILAAIGTASGIILFHKKNSPAPWLTIFNLLIFQPSKVTAYFLYFLMGIYAFKKNWFKKVQIPGHHLVWLTLFVILSILYIFLVRSIMVKSNPVLFIAYLLERTFLCITFLIAFAKLAERYLNKPSKINNSLSSNSYHIYIVHFLPVIVLQYAFSKFPELSSIFKFLFVSFLSVFLSYVVSNFLIRKYPKWSILFSYVILAVVMYFL